MLGGWGEQGWFNLSFNAGTSCRMLSQMCGNWYFLRFLFNEGSFTQMDMASLMFLDVPLCFPVYEGKAVWTEWVIC